jgi:hypothetical protein
MRFVGKSGIAATALLGTLACAAAPPGPATAPATPAVAPRPGSTVPGEYIVTLAPQATSAAIDEVFGSFGIRRTDRVADGVYLISLERDPGIAAMKELQGKDPRLAAVQPNFIYRKSN